jgi:hypothetical protein
MTIWRSPCPTCNFHKSVHLEGFDEHDRTQVRLFNPRTDDWHSHFEFQELTVQIVGRTPIGRATVDRLQLNEPIHLQARPHWIELGVYP